MRRGGRHQFCERLVDMEDFIPSYLSEGAALTLLFLLYDSWIDFVSAYISIYCNRSYHYLFPLKKGRCNMYSYYSRLTCIVSMNSISYKIN